ncbi:hypothetical protein DFP72DRAFT_1102922 [Ephemerocybe angulata]|uniref:Uncharacterized protein n=1 Tax=Ephemerocybe angulata TaxID=980116 RepID=A0A8H6HB83_9AGAR|nr:hypothetical protein DFP72DRAFT_1102922 [Tulosesus angulatus]
MRPFLITHIVVPSHSDKLPSSVDTYTRSKGLLSKANNLALAKLIADHAHEANLAIAQKDTAELGSEGRSRSVRLGTSATGTPASMEPVFSRDTENAQSVFKAACTARGSTFSVILRDRGLVAQGKSGYDYEEC